MVSAYRLSIAQVGGFSPFELFGIAFAVFALPFLGLGIYMIRTGVRKGRISSRRDEFEPVRARVRSSELRKHTSTSGGGGVWWAPEIEYQYSVDGETYTSDSVWPGEDMSGTDRERREEIVDEYSEGEVVEAYYDPADPSVAFLENESRGGASVLLVVMGASATVAGVAGVAFGLVFVL